MKSKLLFICLAAFFVMSAAAKHSNVLMNVKKAADSKLEFDFRVEPIGAIVINPEGPWNLQLKDHEGLNFATKELKVKDFNPKVPGFKLTTSEKVQRTAGKVSYKMVVFVCTKNKEQCFREVHEQSSDWKL